VFAITLPQITSLISTIAWPIVLIVVLWIYRREIPAAVNAASRRISRLSFAGAAVEFATASEAPAEAVSGVTEFIDARTTSAIGSSGGPNDAGSSMQAAIYTTDADFVKINLRGGNGWLTSRLYVFSLILAAAPVKRLVFVARTESGVETFVGMADPRAVAVRLGHRYGWLDYAFADAQSAVVGAPLTPRPPDPMADPEWASFVATQFLAHPLIRRQPEPGVFDAEVPRFQYGESVVPPLPVTSGTSVLDPPVKAIAQQAPTITGVIPPYGPPAGGTPVTITGFGIDAVAGLYFNGHYTSSLWREGQPNVLRAVTPSGSGNGPVTAYAPGSPPSPTPGPEFAYTTHPLPKITALLPGIGPRAGGTTITVDGQGFSGAKEVRFGDARALITSVVDTALNVVIPPGTGMMPVSVKATAGNSSMSNDWVVLRDSTGLNYVEHGRWIENGTDLLSLLQRVLDRTHVIQDGAGSKDEVRREILHAASDLVPVVDPDLQFRRVVDRRGMVERMVGELADAS
jgi:hypothetical protein